MSNNTEKITISNKLQDVRSKAASAETNAAQNTFQRRQKMIHAQVENALARKNSLLANLELAATDLMQMNLWWQEDITQIRADLSDPEERAAVMLSVNEHVNKNIKQLNVGIDLVTRLENKSNAEAESKRPQLLQLPPNPK